MLIRSQDKKTIVNMNNIDTICAKRDEQADKGIKEHYQTSIEYFNGGEETMGTLAEYSTEEKAIKVLDMIAEHYDKVIDARYWNNEYQENVFQMPQDSEV